MKARIKGTNIEVEVQPFYSNRQFVGFSDKDIPGYCTYTKEDLIFPGATDYTNIDWQSFRREAAKDILCSVVANPGRIGLVEYGRKDYRQSEYVRFAIDCAEELIKQLKQE